MSESILVTNPHDGHSYDLGPLFQFIHDTGGSFGELSARCQQAGDAIPQFYNIEDPSYLKEMQDSLFLMNNLREVFGAIHAVNPSLQH